jgi:GTP-binding protein
MQASFIKSAAGADGFPEDSGVEVAVVGRSNSGKSSAINRIVGHGKLARVSKTPGRTQLINFFDLGPGKRLVDLPGYGFARVPERVRQEWRELVESYFTARRSLAGILLTVDIRRGLKDSDQALVDWAFELGLPVSILLTKADKLSRGAGASQRLKVVDALAASGEVTLFSAVNGVGLEAARARLAAWLAGGGEPE